MPDSRISLLRERCESLLSQLVQPINTAATRPLNGVAETRKPEAEALLKLIRRSFSEEDAGQRLQHEALEAARQFGECRAKDGAEVRELIGQLLQACHGPDDVSQQRQIELLTCAIETYLSDRTSHLTDQAQRDSLTKLFNRAVFDQRLHEELARARRYGRTLSLVLFDLDQFKLINDRLGHPAGDEVLQQFANLLQSSLRQSDAAFRYGGDEFAALLPETAGEAAGHLLQRLQERLKHSLRIAQLPEPISLSCGSASFPTDADSTVALLKVADTRLYEDKRGKQMKQG